MVNNKIETKTSNEQVEGIERALLQMNYDGLPLDEAMKNAGFKKDEGLQGILDNIVSKEKEKDPYFPFGQPFSELLKEVEDIENYLGTVGYSINNGWIKGYYDDLKRFKVDELLCKMDISLTVIFQMIDALGQLIKKESAKPIYLQNKIKECLNTLNEAQGSGQVLQIIILQGLIEWFEGCDIEENDKGYKEAENLLTWVSEKHLEVCVYYFMFFNKDDNSKPLDEYLATTDIGIAWERLKNEPPQPDANSLSKNTQLPEGLSSDAAVAIFQKAITAGICSANGNGYTWNSEKYTKQLLAYFCQKSSLHLGLSNKKDKDGNVTVCWKPFEIVFSIKNIKSGKNDWMKANTKFTPNGYLEIDKVFS